MALTAPLFLSSMQTLADSSESGTNEELTKEVRSIIERNQANWGFVKTLQGVIRIENKISYGDLGSTHRIETERFWFDNHHLRSDILENKHIGQSKPIVQEKSEGYKITAEGRLTGVVEIKSNESHLLYVPRAQRVMIFPPKGDDTALRRDNVLLRYQTIEGPTLKEKVLKNAAKGFYCTVTSDMVEQDECLLLKFDYPNDAKLRVWVVPSKGYCIKKMQHLYKGKVDGEYVTTLKEYSPGFWWLASAKARHSAGGILNHTVEVSVDSLTFNAPINQSVFTLAGTDIPHGTRVNDQVAGLGYIYGEGFKITGDDVDLALDAVKDSMGRTIEEAEESGEEHSPEGQTNAKNDPSKMEQSQPAPLGKTGSRYPLILLF